MNESVSPPVINVEAIRRGQTFISVSRYRVTISVIGTYAEFGPTSILLL